MKRTDITEGAILALWVGYGRTGDHDIDYGWRRVKTINPGPVERPKAQPYMYPHSQRAVTDGVLVQPLKDNGHKDGDALVVALKNLVCTWDQHVALLKESQEAKEVHHDHLRELAAERNDAIRRIKKHVPRKMLPYWATKADVRPHTDWSGVNGGDGKMYVTDLAEIVEAAYRAGFTAGRQSEPEKPRNRHLQAERRRRAAHKPEAPAASS
jgi:hypothetical protein